MTNRVKTAVLRPGITLFSEQLNQGVYKTYMKLRVYANLFKAKTRYARRRLTAIAICIAGVYGLARLALAAHGWWLTADFGGVLVCMLVVVALTYFTLRPFFEWLKEPVEQVGVWLFELLMLLLVLVRHVVMKIYDRIRLHIARKLERRRRRKNWEAQRFPSFSAPSAPFYLGE